MKRLIKKILLLILIIVTIYNLSYVVLKMLKQDSFFGIRFYIPISNSMKPEMEQKDVVVLKKAKEKKLKQDDIILYKDGENIRIGRITKINENYGKISYVVKADNRYLNDTEQLLIENIKGKMIKKVSNGAIFIKMLRSKILTVFVIIILLLAYKMNQYKKYLTKRRKKRNNRLKKG